MKAARTIAALALCVLLAAAGVWLLGNTAIRHPDANPDALRAGAVLRLLRDGSRFSLAQAYPEAWETARFVSSSDELTRREQSALFAYDARFAEAERGPLVLLWCNRELVSAIPMPDDQLGYPRFFDAMGERSFSLTREEASFLCTFVESEGGRGGYYECQAQGGQAV